MTELLEVLHADADEATIRPPAETLDVKTQRHDRLDAARHPSISDFRYERKCLVAPLQSYELEHLIRFHPALFSPIYQPRYVNNIYLDTIDRACYVESVEGIRERVKVRIRWYGTMMGIIEKPTLELKIKRGLVGRKVSCSLTPFVLDDAFNSDVVDSVFSSSRLPEFVREFVSGLEPSLLNRYHRSYFQTEDRRFRITIDSGLQYFGIYPSHNSFFHEAVDRENTVLEIKYAREHDSEADEISRHFPFRVTKSSKYTMGLDRLSYESYAFGS